MRNHIAAIITIGLLAQFSPARLFSEEGTPLAKTPFNAQQARRFQEQWASRINKKLLHANSIGMKLKLIPPGEFTMGRREEQFDQLMKIIETDPQMKKLRGGMVTWSMLMMPA
ncbi:MAG: hypothetical protein ABGX05_05150, partial [Pirellulaceae bacterium]